MEEEIEQKYYSITELSKMFGVNPSLIRYWETEFDTIRPKKGSRGVRQFTKQDIESFRLVYHLVKEKGHTIQGAKEILRKSKGQKIEKLQLVEQLKKVREFLVELRTKIQ